MRTCQVAVVKDCFCQCRRQETWVRSLGWEDPLEEGLATRSSILTWRIPWTEEHGSLLSMGLHRVGHDWCNLACNRRTSRQSAYLRESDKLTPRGKLVQSLWKTLWRFLKQLKIELTYEPVIPFLGICLEEILIWKDTCPPMFVAALFTIAKTKKQFKCPLTYTCIGLP